MKAKKICAVALATTLAMSVLAGCGSNTSDKAATASKQELTYNLGGDPRTLDPALCSDTVSTMVIANGFTGLTELDKNEKAIPANAEKWDVSADGLTYTFHFRKDLKWSNGDPLTAKD